MGYPETDEAQQIAIAALIRIKREELGFTQAQLANSIGLTRVAVASIENAYWRTTLSTFSKFAQFLKFSADEIIDIIHTVDVNQSLKEAQIKRKKAQIALVNHQMRKAEEKTKKLQKEILEIKKEKDRK